MRFLIVVACFIKFLAVSIFLMGPANAAQRSFGPFSFDDSSADVIILYGEIGVNSALDFRRVLQAAPGARFLALNSPGGVVQSALLIADDVHQRNIATFIPKSAKCYSACSYIFFAGPVHHVEGQLGVHQISSTDGDSDMVSTQYSISDILDVLNRFNTPPDVLTIMFRTPPTEMHVFTPDEVIRFNINSKGRNSAGGANQNASNALPGLSSNVPEAASSDSAQRNENDVEPNVQAPSKRPPIEEYSKRPTRIAVYAGLDLFGSDIAFSRTKDTGECAKSCLSMNGRCTAFTFNTNQPPPGRPNCFLKDSAGEAEGNPAAISGWFLSASDPDPRPMSVGVIDTERSIFKDVNLPGGDILEIPLKSASTVPECRLACIIQKRCVAFTYVKSKAECWLKNAPGKPVYASGMVSGLKKVQTVSPAKIIPLQ